MPDGPRSSSPSKDRRRRGGPTFRVGIFQREGLRLADLTPAQRAAVNTLLSTALSKDGYRKVTEIMRGDEVLRTGQSGRGGGDGRGRGGASGGGGGGVRFGEDEYFLAFVGTPSVTAPWMLQFGGHHLAINLTLAGSQASMAPSLPAAQPATYTFEGRTVRPLGNENDKAFALINALDDAQRKQAILSYRVVRSRARTRSRTDETIQPEGIRASALTPPQQTMLLELVREWAGIMNDAFAEAADGGDPDEPSRHLLRLERADDQRQRGVFPDPGTDPGHRVRAARRRRPHPHHLSRSDQRLRCEVRAGSRRAARRAGR